jgi:pimeloyl-ACP methyl ester carboxylesterase
MATFLLIHGASHGAWCWSKLIPHLEALGHEVRAIDLPGSGDDPTPPDRVTMTAYANAATGALTGDTILVGHSLGGLTITLAAHRAPEKVRALVYLCAFVPPPGQPFAEIRKNAITPALQGALITDRANGVSIPIEDKAGPVFYHDCTPEDVAFAVPRLTPQPIQPLLEPLLFDPPETPRHYIKCTEDRVIKPAYQRDITAGWPDHTVHEIECGHSPFFSDPDKLAEILDRIAKP